MYHHMDRIPVPIQTVQNRPAKNYKKQWLEIKLSEVPGFRRLACFSGSVLRVGAT